MILILNVVNLACFIVYSGPVCSSHPVYYGHWTISQNFQLNFIFCKVDLYIAATLYIMVTADNFPKVSVVLYFLQS